MIARCYDPRSRGFSNYGARGIEVCDRWRHSFANFLADIGTRPSPRHTLDRIDSDGNYEPTNCRWATWIAQQNNRRNNRILVCDGESKTLAEWARTIGLPLTTLVNRLKLGWSAEEALTKRRRPYPRKQA